MSNIKSIGYTVYIGDSALNELKAFLPKKKYSAIYIVCDENSLQHCLPTLILACPSLSEAQIIETESGEQNKTLDIAQLIWQTLLEQQSDKNTLLINLGGGVITDLGGFVAALYKRGIDFVAVPTTLLAMADASVGGKNGIDFMGLKNNLGTVTQPQAVFIYPPFLNSLPPRHIRNGWVEIYKMALVADKIFWTRLQKNQSLELNVAFIEKAVALKNKIVIKDPNDKGVRKILNFGHSIGHAIEALYLGSSDELLHGEAVCMGMLVESELAYQKKFISKKERDEIKNTLKSFLPKGTIQHFNLESILPYLKQDKKNDKTTFRFSLIRGIGNCDFDVPVTESQIIKAISAFHASLQ